MSGPTGEHLEAKRGARAHSQCNGWCLEYCGHSCSFHQVRVRAESGRVHFLNAHVIPALRVLGSRPKHGCRCIHRKGEKNQKTKKPFFTFRNFLLLFSQRELDKHIRSNWDKGGTAMVCFYCIKTMGGFRCLGTQGQNSGFNPIE